MTKKDQKISADLINNLLADTSVLLIQTLRYHWNLVGSEFCDYHLMFDGQYDAIFADLDLLAERVRAVQGQALGSMHEMIKHANLKEDTGKIPTPKQMVVNLVKQYEKYITCVRKAIVTLDEVHDFGSVNMLEDLLMRYEKTAWILRSLTGK